MRVFHLPRPTDEHFAEAVYRFFDGEPVCHDCVTLRLCAGGIIEAEVEASCGAEELTGESLLEELDRAAEVLAQFARHSHELADILASHPVREVLVECHEQGRVELVQRIRPPATASGVLRSA